MPWWWCDLVAWATSPAACAASEPVLSVDVVVGAVEGAEHAPVLLVSDVLGEVLQQRAAAGDVDQLHPPADAEHRHVPLDRGGGSAISKASRSGTVSIV